MKMLRLVLLYLRPAGLDFASGGAGLTGGLLGMKAAKGLPEAPPPMLQHGGTVDQMLFAALQQMSGMGGRNAAMTDQSIVEAYAKMLGIDTSGLIGAGQQAGQAYQGLADTAGLYGNTMQNRAMGSFGAADQQRDAGMQAWLAGLDPQNALRDRMQQQVVDSSRAGQSARGLAMGPYGAGIENKAVGDFNIDWQNQQLSRQLAGLQGMGQAFSGANQSNAAGSMGLQDAMGYQGMVPGLTMAAAQAPIAGQQAAYSMPMDWASMFTQAQNQNVLGPNQQAISAMYPYLQGAAAGSQNFYQNEMNTDLQRNTLQQQAQYGLWGGGQSQTPTMGGSQSGFGNPMNWMGMGGMGG